MEDKRLQFRNHADIFASRDEALTYFDNIVDVMHIYSTEFGDSLYSEPLVAKYLDESGETRVILAIGVDSGHTPYHIIDSTQLRELIQKNADDIVAETERAMAAENFLSGTLQTEIDRSIAKDEDLQQQINDNKVKIESVAPSSENVLEEYSLTNALGEVLGTNIKIYKDQALVHAMIGFKGAMSVTVNEDGEYNLIYDEAERDESVEYLYLVYKDVNGDLKLVGIDFERFLQEAEIGNGLKVEDHKVAIKIKDDEQFLTVDSNGLATSGIQDSINTAISGLSEEFLEKLNAEIERSTAADEYISGVTSAFSAATVAEIESLKEADVNLNEKIDNEIERATTREDELDAQIKTNKIVSKDVVLSPSESGTTLSIQVDEKTITKYASASTIYDSQVAVLGTLLKIKKVTPTESTVKYQFQLQDADGNMLGDEIKISNEGSLEKIEIGYVGDVIDPATGQYASRGPNPDDHSLNFIYRLSDGTYSLTSIRIADYFTSALFGRGLNNQDGKISLLEGEGNEFLVIGEDTIAVVGVSNAIESAKTEAMQLSQDLYNAATAMTEEKATSALTYAMDKFAEATAYTFENVSSAFTYTTESFEKANQAINSAFTYTSQRFDAATAMTEDKATSALTYAMDKFAEATAYTFENVSSAFTYTTESFEKANQAINSAFTYTSQRFDAATAMTEDKATSALTYAMDKFAEATAYTFENVSSAFTYTTERFDEASQAINSAFTYTSQRFDAATAMTEEKATSALTYAMDKFAESTAYTFENVSSAFTYTTESFEKANQAINSAFTYTSQRFDAATAATQDKVSSAFTYTTESFNKALDGINSAFTYTMDKFAEATAYTFENVSSAFTYTTESFDAATSMTQNGLNELTDKLNKDVSSAFTYTTNSFNAATAHTDTKFGEATAYTDTKHTESIDYTNQQFNNATSYTDSQITAVTKSITELSNTLSNALTTEITNREAADKDIISKIEAESETRQQEDTAIRKEITDLTQTVNDKTFTIESNIDALSAVSHSHSNKDVLDAITSADTDSWRNAEKNAIESAKTYTDAQISSITSQVSIAYHYVGTVDTMEHLPASADVGAVYNVVLAHGNPGEPDYTPAGTNYAWNGVSWDALGGSVDLSSFATSDRVEEIYDELTNVSGVSHTHANKDALDTITSDKIDRWNLTADEAIRGVYLNGEPIAPINNTVNIDLADYGNRDWVIEQIDKAIADFDKYGYATQTWVTAQIDAASNVLQLQIDSVRNNFEEFEKHVIDNYATSADTHNAIEKAAQEGKDYTDEQFDTINPVTEITHVTKVDTNYTSEEADKYQIDHHVDSKTIQLTYTPLSPLTLTVPETLGDIERGMSCEELNGMPLSQILDNIIFKTIYPTITQPTGSVSFKNGFSNNSIMEAGLAMPQDTNMNYSFNPGNVEVDDGVTEDIDYVGAATGVKYQVTYSPGTANANAGVGAGGSAFTGRALDGSKMTVGRYQFRGIISYGQGPVMATSKGNTPNPMRTNNAGNVTNPHPASSLTTSYNLTLNITLPVWIDNNADGTYNKQALKTWGAMTFTGVAMAGQNSGKPTRVKTPRKINTINSYNEVSGKYDVPQKSNYKMEEITENVNGVEVDYFEYTWIGGALDTVKFEIITY